MSAAYARFLLVLVGMAAALGLIIAALVYAGGTRRSKRYRPGRPFEFAPVWFLAAKPGQARAGLVTGRELAVGRGEVGRGEVGRGASGAWPVVGPRQTGGASEHW